MVRAGCCGFFTTDSDFGFDSRKNHPLGIFGDLESMGRRRAKPPGVIDAEQLANP